MKQPRDIQNISTYDIQIDRWEMNKNTMKSDFKWSSPIDKKIQIKNGGDSLRFCVGGCMLIVCDDFYGGH